MRKDVRRLVALAALVGAVGLMGPLPASAKHQTCAKRINDAAKMYFDALVQAAGNKCRRTPGGTCFDVDVPGKAPASKKLKQCTAADITAQFGGKCISRDRSCVPAAVTTTADVAACIKCGIKAEVKCLTAAAYSAGNLPDTCTGSPSGAFLDADESPCSRTADGGNAR